jgi:hypothetical protein
VSKRINERGNAIYDSFHPVRERYYYDQRLVFSRRRRGWRQYDTDQDAWYFGVWVQLERRMVLVFAEGDASLIVCPTVESFRAELASMAAFYGDPPPAWTVIDADGRVTRIYDPRPALED